MKYLLLTPADVDVIRTALESQSHDTNDYNCPDQWDSCWGCDGKEKRDAALKHFDQLPWEEGTP
jgi:hypothetical protein